MIQFEFRGRVLPEIFRLSLDYSPTVQRSADDEPDSELTLRIADGKVWVTVRTAEYSQYICETLFHPAWDLARSAVEVAGFINGIPFSVVIDEALGPDGTRQAMPLGDPVVAGCQSFGTEDLEQLMDLVLTDFPLSLALSDLLMMLGRAHYSPIAGGRVADSLARLVAPSLPRAAMWAKLRATLHVDEAYLRLLTESSEASRHGDRTEVPASITREISVRAWTLMERYLRFRLGDSVPLDTNKYPTLKG